MAMHCKNLYIHHFPRQSMCEVATQAAGWICCTFVKHLAYYVNKNRHSGQTNLTVKQHSLLNTSVKSLFKVTSTVSRRLVESIIQVFDLFLFLQETYSRVTFYIFSITVLILLQDTFTVLGQLMFGEAENHTCSGRLLPCVQIRGALLKPNPSQTSQKPFVLSESLHHILAFTFKWWYSNKSNCQRGLWGIRQCLW